MKENKVCTACGFYGKPVKAIKGSGWIEVVLWLCYIAPGLIYSIWRRSNQSAQCPVCGSTVLIPSTSPLARKLIQEGSVTL